MITLDFAQSELRTVRSPKAEQEAESAYFEAARWRTLDTIKQPEREKVMRHILDHWSAPGHELRLLSNPAMHWHFERMIEAELGEYAAYFTGLERSWQVIELGQQYQPGKFRRKQEWRFGDEKLSAIASRKSSVFWCSFEDWPRFANILRTTENEGIFPCLWWGQIASWNAMWIDIWQPCLRIEFAKALRALPSLIDKRAEIVPYVITCQYGRDPFCFDGVDGLDGRAAGISAELSRGKWHAETTNSWWYYGWNDTRMMTVCGVLRKKTI